MLGIFQKKNNGFLILLKALCIVFVSYGNLEFTYVLKYYFLILKNTVRFDFLPEARLRWILYHWIFENQRVQNSADVLDKKKWIKTIQDDPNTASK